SEEKIFHGFRGLFAEYERAKIIERFRLGKLRAIKEGHIIASRPLFGYNRIPNQKLPNQEKIHGHYEINEEEATTVRKIFTWVGDEGLTIRQVVRRLQELRIAPRRSKRGVWSTSTLTTMLRNEGYIGRAHWYSSVSVEPKNPISKEKYRRIKKSSTKRRPKSEWMYVPVPVIIDEELFNRARTRLSEHAALNPRSKKYDYLLGGKISCVCGQKRIGAGRRQGKYLYYDCCDKILAFPLPRKCHEHPINARVADKLVWSKIADLMSSPALLMKQIERWIKSRQNKTSVSMDDTEVMIKQVSKLREKEERYTKAYGAGLLTMEQLKEYAIPLREEVTSLELQISRARQELQRVDLQTAPNEEEIAIFAESARKILHDLSFDQKRAIVLNTVEKIIGTQEQLHVSGYISVTTHGWYKTKDRNRRSPKCR
ncbi:MAG: recombinase family protein, partial [Candidatus Paceibacterota bacterium]